MTMDGEKEREKRWESLEEIKGRESIIIKL